MISYLNQSSIRLLYTMQTGIFTSFSFFGFYYYGKTAGVWIANE